MRQLVFITFLLQAKLLLGINGPVKLMKVCLNTADSSVSLLWKKNQDNCNAFKKNEIWGKKPTSLPILLDEVYSNDIETSSFKIPDFDPDWIFFIKTYSDCSGSNFFVSDTLKMDLQRPAAMPIDSVSIDTSGRLLVGWQKSKDKDTYGYRLYKNQGGINDSIFNSLYTYAYLDAHQFSFIGLAPYDSCSLFAPISMPHRAAKLSASIQGCGENIQLTWTTYRGWAVQRQEILIDSGGGQFYLYAVLGEQETDHLLENFPRGKTIRVLLRSYRSGGAMSSSSNTLRLTTQNLRKIQYPKILRVSTVSNDSLLVELAPLSLKNQSYWSLRLNGESTISGNQIQTDSLVFLNKTDLGLVQNKIQLATYNTCDEIVGISKIHQNIVLVAENKTLSWNNYQGWPQIDQSHVLVKEGSTWNFLGTSNQGFQISNEKSGLAYRIQQSFNGFSSFSNTVVPNEPFALFFPNSLNPASNNHQLVFYGPNMNLQESTGHIYNRWGNRVASFPLSEPQFSARDFPTGVYQMILFLVNKRQKKKTQQASLYILH